MNKRIHLTALAFLLSAGYLLPNASAATRTAVADGNWTSSATWSPAGAPAAGDDVVIPAGRAVTYNSTSAAVIKTVKINGVLKFNTTANTNLNVGVITIGADMMATSSQPGTLIVGDAANPVPRGVTATIQLAETAGQVTANHPGIFCQGGRIVVHGAEIVNPWVKLNSNAGAGNSSVRVDGASITDWQVGDEIIIVGTNNNKSGFGDSAPTYNQAASTHSVARTEKRTITAINYSTGYISFSGNLVHDHTSVAGNYPEVANLTRTVAIQSLDRSVDTRRGHVFVGAHSSGSISYGRFDGLGKEGVLGRYPIHVHMPGSTSRGFSIVGNAITDSHNKFVTLHRCNYVLMRDNVGYQCFTTGFFMEDGTEVNNLWDRNLAVQAMFGAKAPNEAIDYMTGKGYGFWWVNGRNAVINNVSAENDEFGIFFQIESVKKYYGVPQNPNPNSTAKVPLVVPMWQEDGTTTDTTVQGVRLLRFENNEVHNEHTWGFVIKGGKWSVASPAVAKNNIAWSNHYPFTVNSNGLLADGTTSWNSNYGLEIGRIESGQHTDNVTFKNAYIKDSSVQNLNLYYAGSNTTFAGTTSLLRSSTSFLMGSCIFLKSDNFDSTVLIENLVEDYPDRIWGGSGNSGENDFIYINNRYGAGSAAKIKGNANNNPGDGLTYVHDPELNYLNNNKTATVSNFTGNTPLVPVDQRKPVSVITSIGGTPGTVHQVSLQRAANGSVTLEGYAIDDGTIANVKVNGVTATAVESDWSIWKVTLPNVALGNVTFTSVATDVSGKVEGTPHSVTVPVVDAAGGGGLPLGVWVRLQNEWSGNYLRATGSQTTGGPVTHEAIQSTWTTPQWMIEDAGGGYYRLKNKWSGLYLRAQGDQTLGGVVNHEAIQSTWSTPKWTMELISGNQYRLNNLWSGLYLRAKSDGTVEHATSEPEWVSPRWNIEIVQ